VAPSSAVVQQIRHGQKEPRAPFTCPMGHHRTSRAGTVRSILVVVSPTTRASVGRICGGLKRWIALVPHGLPLAPGALDHMIFEATRRLRVSGRRGALPPRHVAIHGTVIGDLHAERRGRRAPPEPTAPSRALQRPADFSPGACNGQKSPEADARCPGHTPTINQRESNTTALRPSRPKPTLSASRRALNDRTLRSAATDGP
jgi:hypothetical protein